MPDNKSVTMEALVGAQEEPDGGDIILTPAPNNSPLRPRGIGSGIWNAFTDALFAVVAFTVGQVIFLTFELGPAAAAAYLSGKSLYEIWSTKSVFHMTTGEIAVVVALATLLASGGLRIARIMRERVRGVLKA